MIRIENLSKSFTDRILLDRLSYHFPENERIALIGANGQGKTTLLNILSRNETANSGQVMQPKAMRLAFLTQSPSLNPEPTIRQECMSGHQELFAAHQQMARLLEKMAVTFQDDDYATYEKLLSFYEKLLSFYENNDGYQLEGNAEKILLGLGLTVEQLDQHPFILSGGWRMRLELAKTLTSRADFLILDEPTNHLDLPSIEWLEEYLKNFKGTLLFVSHDRSFLNSVSTITLYLKGGKLQPFKGNFDDFLNQREQTKKTEGASLKKLSKQQAHMQRFVDRFRGTPSKIGQVNSRKKSIAKLQEVAQGITMEVADAKMHLPNLPFTVSGKDVFQLKELDIGYVEPLVKKISLLITRGQRVAIVGKNGIGKSTLLKTVGGFLLPLKGTVTRGHNVNIGFYNQNAADEMMGHQNLVETLQSANPLLSEQIVRGLLGMMLFKGSDITKIVSVLSGGERSRLALCCLLAKAPNCLVLDEPTNHLDLMSTQLLADMLQDYKGTVLFVSHDRDFIEQVATSVIEIDGQKAHFYERS